MPTPVNQIVLKGNHEQMFLEWIVDYRNPFSDGTENLEIFVKAIECEVAQPPVDSEENKKLLEKELILFRDLPF